MNNEQFTTQIVAAFKPMFDLYATLLQNSNLILPQPTVPQPTVPQPTVPQPTVPQPTVPQPTVPYTPMSAPMQTQQSGLTLQDVISVIQMMNNRGMYRTDQPQTVEQITADIINPPNIPEYGMEGNGGRGENGERYDIYSNFNRTDVNN